MTTMDRTEPSRPALAATPEFLLSLYRQMQLIRVVELRIAELYPEQEMRCPVHLSVGQEAAEAGACAALEGRDYVMSGHRSHGHYLGKGGDLKRMMAEIYGKVTGCASGVGGSMHLIDLDAGFLGAAPIVGSTIPIAVGSAFASKLRGDDSVTMLFLGDGATECGVFHESLNFAKLHELAVVFVCENNFFSVYSPMDVRQPKDRPIRALAEAHGIESHLGDGNDVVEVYQLTKRAVDRARAGKGPSFIELTTYRWLEHCGPNYDNDIGYRSEEEYLAWRAKEPVARYETQLIARGVATRDQLDAITASIGADMEEAVAYAKTSPFPPAEAMALNVYAP
jgi:TPP-dependent pyruvate/acetoin dehydrogenase alpha subunit